MSAVIGWSIQRSFVDPDHVESTAADAPTVGIGSDALVLVVDVHDPVSAAVTIDCEVMGGTRGHDGTGVDSGRGDDLRPDEVGGRLVPTKALHDGDDLVDPPPDQRAGIEFRINRKNTAQSFEVTLIDCLRVDGSEIGDGLPIGRVQRSVHADMLPRGRHGDRTENQKDPEPL